MTPGAPGVGTGSVSIARNSRTASLCREIKIVREDIWCSSASVYGFVDL